MVSVEREEVPFEAWTPDLLRSVYIISKTPESMTLLCHVQPFAGLHMRMCRVAWGNRVSTSLIQTCYTSTNRCSV